MSSFLENLSEFERNVKPKVSTGEVFNSNSIKYNLLIHRLCPFHCVGSCQHNWIYWCCPYKEPKQEGYFHGRKCITLMNKHNYFILDSWCWNSQSQCSSWKKCNLCWINPAKIKRCNTNNCYSTFIFMNIFRTTLMKFTNRYQSSNLTGLKVRYFVILILIMISLTGVDEPYLEDMCDLDATGEWIINE